MPEWVKILSADMAMGVVTIVIVQIIKGLLPSPVPALGEAPDRWKVIPQLKYVPLALAFVIGMLLSIFLPLEPSKTIVLQIRGGLQTGAWAVAGWEVYSVTIQPTVEKMFAK